MLSNVTLLYYDINNVLHTFDRVFRLRLIKDFYTPYAMLSAGVLCNAEPPAPKKLVLKIGETTMHCGVADSVHFRTEAGAKRLFITSKSFTSLLTQNQMTTGMVTDISLDSLITDYFTFPEITCETDATEANYIYCKSGSTMWNAIENLTRKLYSRHPYVRGNTVMMKLPASPASITASDARVLATGTVHDYTRMFSHMHMEDINGSANTYNSTNQTACLRNIVRHRQLELDRQDLNNPAASLGHKMSYSNRAFYAKYAELSEASVCELCDIATAGVLDGDYISRIELTGADGVFRTKLYAYFDDYCNVTAT